MAHRVYGEAGKKPHAFCDNFPVLDGSFFLSEPITQSVLIAKIMVSAQRQLHRHRHSFPSDPFGLTRSTCAARLRLLSICIFQRTCGSLWHADTPMLLDMGLSFQKPKVSEDLCIIYSDFLYITDHWTEMCPDSPSRYLPSTQVNAIQLSWLVIKGSFLRGQEANQIWVLSKESAFLHCVF